jgi:IS30 family transposase
MQIPRKNKNKMLFLIQLSSYTCGITCMEKVNKKNKAIKHTDSVKNYISEKLKEYWSPEKTMGRLKLNKKIKISSETAYRD